MNASPHTPPPSADRIGPVLLGLVSAALGFFSLLTSEPVGGLFAVAAVVCGVMVFVVQWRRTGWDG